MNVCDAMTTRLITIGILTPLGKVKEIFDKLKLHHVLVIEGGKLVGIVSDRDLLLQISPYAGTPDESSLDVMTLKKTANQIMTKDPMTITQDMTVVEAGRFMLEKHVSCLPVVNRVDGSVEGLITMRDLVKVLTAQTVKN